MGTIATGDPLSHDGLLKAIPIKNPQGNRGLVNPKESNPSTVTENTPV